MLIGWTLLIAICDTHDASPVTEDLGREEDLTQTVNPENKKSTRNADAQTTEACTGPDNTVPLQNI